MSMNNLTLDEFLELYSRSLFLGEKLEIENIRYFVEKNKVWLSEIFGIDVDKDFYLSDFITHLDNSVFYKHKFNKFICGKSLEFIDRWAFEDTIIKDFVFQSFVDIGEQSFLGAEISNMNAEMINSISFGGFCKVKSLQELNLCNCITIDSLSFSNSEISKLVLREDVLYKNNSFSNMYNLYEVVILGKNDELANHFISKNKGIKITNI